VAAGPGLPAKVRALLAEHAGGRGLIVAGGGAAAGAHRGVAGLEGAESGGDLAAVGGDGAALVAAAQALGWPLFADPRSGCRVPAEPVVAAADALLRVPEVAAWRPDIVLRLGAPWASKVLGQWLAGLGSEVQQVLVDPWGEWRDPDRQVAHVVSADPVVVASDLAAIAGGSRWWRASRWAGRWATAERAAQATLADLLSEGSPLGLSEPGVARAEVAGIPDGGALMVSSSMPVRDVEWYSAPREKAVVVSNRGANGIDGVLATAIGVGLGTGAPVITLMGDLAFLYDAGSLLGATRRDLALTVIVVDNDGGGIFSFLSQATALPGEQFERYWGTPHGSHLGVLAAAYGVDVTEVGDRRGLDAVLGAAGQPGVRVAVVRSDRSQNVVVHDRLHAAVGEAVAGL
jgi:2-succinyl-5-enolpyruvyl-6-hydroxy-3-cyclohexene-1-carboxylate synthase